MENTDNDWKDSPLSSGILFLILLASPLGAPTVAFAVVVSGAYRSQWLFDVLPEDIVLYYGISAFLPVFALGYLGFLWWAASLVAVVKVGWAFVCSIWSRSHALW